MYVQYKINIMNNKLKILIFPQQQAISSIQICKHISKTQFLSPIILYLFDFQYLTNGNFRAKETRTFKAGNSDFPALKLPERCLLSQT